MEVLNLGKFMGMIENMTLISLHEMKKTLETN